MRRWICIVPLALFVIAVVNTDAVWSQHQPTETQEFTEPDRVMVEDPIGYSQFSAECEAVFNTVQTTVTTYVNTVVTIAKVVVNAVKTVVVSIGKLAVRFAFVIAKALVSWLIAVIF